MCVRAFDSLTARLCLRSVSILRVKKEANTKTHGRTSNHFTALWSLAYEQIVPNLRSVIKKRFLTFRKCTCIRKIKSFFINKWHFPEGTRQFSVNSDQTMPEVDVGWVTIALLIG